MKIVKIEKKRYEGNVYNLHCSINNNYIANGIVVHNCYKSNTNAPARNMTLDTYKKVLDNFGGCLDQVALGLTGIKTNPDLIPILEYTRSKGVVPNFTISGIDLDWDMAKKIAPLVGAVAVSVYPSDKRVAYTAIKMLKDAGVRNVNIHLMISQETLDFVYEVVEDVYSSYSNWGLSDLVGAVIFLSVKPKGRAKDEYTPLSQESFDQLIFHCLDYNYPIGMDSCSASKFERYVRNHTKMTKEQKDSLLVSSESCESGLFSIYVNVDGDVFPCSFCEGETDLALGPPMNMTTTKIETVWNSAAISWWRQRLLDSRECGCRKCLAFPSVN